MANRSGSARPGERNPVDLSEMGRRCDAAVVLKFEPGPFVRRSINKQTSKPHREILSVSTELACGDTKNFTVVDLSVRWLVEGCLFICLFVCLFVCLFGCLFAYSEFVVFPFPCCLEIQVQCTFGTASTRMAITLIVVMNEWNAPASQPRHCKSRRNRTNKGQNTALNTE